MAPGPVRSSKERVDLPILVVADSEPMRRLYVNVLTDEGIEIVTASSKDEALALIDELADHTIDPRFRHVHHWRVGDLLMWDNCSTQHNAIANYGPHQRRHMRRTTVRGSAPF